MSSSCIGGHALRRQRDTDRTSRRLPALRALAITDRLVRSRCVRRRERLSARTRLRVRGGLTSLLLHDERLSRPRLSLLALRPVVALAPGLNGAIKRMKAALQGRKGPPLLQPYFDLAKLLRKDAVVSEHSSAVFRWAPAVYAACFATAALLVPVLWSTAPLGGWGDAIALVGLFALARFALALAGLVAGSSFGGMGSSREVATAALAEPARLLVLFAVAWRSGGTDLSGASAHLVAQGSRGVRSDQLLSRSRRSSSSSSPRPAASPRTTRTRTSSSR